MGQLTNQYVSQSYQGLLNLNNANTGLTANLQTVTDGLGGSSPLQISQTQVNISGTFTINGSPVVATDTGSLMKTGSVSNDVLTFTKGDGSTFSLAVTSSLPAGTVSGSQQIVNLGFATTSSLDSLSGSIASTDLGQNNRLTALETFTGSIDTGYVSEAEFGNYTSSMNNFTSSIDGRVDALEIETGSLQNQINQKLDTGSFNSYTSSTNSRLNSLEIETGSLQNQINQKLDTGSFNTYTSSVNAHLAALDIETGSLQNQINGLATTGSLSGYTTVSTFNSYTSSNDGKVDSLINATSSYVTETESGSFVTNVVSGLTSDRIEVTKGNGSTNTVIINDVQNSFSLNNTGSGVFATTGSNNFVGQQNINGSVNVTGSLNVTGEITALSASITYLETIYQTSSVVFSSGSNILGDASNDTQTLWGTVNLPSGPLVVTGSVTSTGGFTGSLQGTASYATNALSSSHAIFADTASFVQNAISSSYATNADTASIAYDVVVYGKCNNPGGLTRGTVVRIVGADGNNPLFDSASWTDDLNSANTLGVLSEDVASNAFANVVVQGKLVGINTSGFTAGDMMYLSSSGQYTTQSVPAPYHEVRLGQVLRVNQNNGSMYVNIDNGYELTELHDVDIQAPIVGDVLTYVSGSYGQWVNKTVDELGYLQTSSFNTYSGNTLNLINQKLDTGSFNTYTASMDARTGSYATTGSNRFNGNQTITGSLVVSGSSTIIGNSTISGSLIASGSHTIVGNLVMTGALLISSSAATDILLTGAMVITRPVGSTAAANLIVTSSAGAATINPNTITSRNGSTTTGTLGTFSGFYISNTSIATGDEMGFSIQPGTYGISGGTGNVFYTNDPTDSYPAMINFQNKATWTDGRISLLRSTDITGSLIASGSSHRFIGALNNTGSLTQSGSVNLIGNTNVTGSLIVTGSATITGSVNGNVNNLTVASNTASLNLNNGNFFVLALTGSQDIRIEPSNIKAGQTVNIKLNTTGSATVSFPAVVKQVSGSSYVPTTTTGVDVITLVSFDNTDLYLANVKNLI